MVKHPSELSVVECVTILRRSVGEWNQLRVAHPYWRAYLGGANLGGANLGGADLRDADLRGADLRDATIGDHQLTGRTSVIGECAGYEVRLFATKDGHVLQADCWTGTLDEAVERALEERGDDLTRVEVEAVVAHGRALLKAWEARGG